MKAAFASILLIPFFSVLLLAQPTQQTESQKLTNQISALYKEGKLDEAIPLAERVIKLQKNAEQKNYRDLSLALLNLATLKKEKGKRLRQTQGKERADAMRQSFDYMEGAESALNDVLDIQEKYFNSQTAEMAVAKGEIAWLLWNNLYPGRRNVNAQKRVSDAEKLYLESIVEKEKLLGPASFSTLATMMDLGEYYLWRLELEKAYPVFQKYVGLAETTKGVDQRQLEFPLNIMTQIQVSTGGQKQASALWNKLSKITGKTDNLPEANLNLSKRRMINGNSDVVTVMERPITGAVIIPGVVADGPIMRSPPDAILRSDLADILGPVALGVRSNKLARVKILIDEQGIVEEATADVTDEKIKAKAEKDVLKWKFRPFVMDGERRKMRGWVVYYL